ncbi:TetR/AcrR family transcriptional regulator [Nocardia sp. NPDC004711]
MKPASDTSRAELPPQPDAPESRQRGAGLQAVTDAARDIFAERGYHGASIRDIAKRAGVSLSLLYYWYPNKQALLAALIEDIDDDYQRRCAEALRDTGDDAVRQLRNLVRALVEFRIERRIDSNIALLEHRNIEPENSARFHERTLASVETWDKVIRDGISRGQFHSDHPEDARRAILAACNGIASWYSPEGDLTPADIVERYSAIALRIVGAPRECH